MSNEWEGTLEEAWNLLAEEDGNVERPRVGSTTWLAAGLARESEFGVRVRFRTSNATSDWSAIKPFVTPELTIDEPYVWLINRPEDAEEGDLRAFLATNDFRLNMGSAEHTSSDWELSLTEDFEELVASSYGDGGSKTNWETEIELDKVYWVRVRHNSADLGTSVWSKPISFPGDLTKNRVAAVYGGSSSHNGTVYNYLVRFLASGAQMGGQTAIGTRRLDLAGAGIGTLAIYHGGYIYRGSTTHNRTVTRANSNGQLVGIQTLTSYAANGHKGVGIERKGLFYGGAAAFTLDHNGDTLGRDTGVGTARFHMVGGLVRDLALYWAGAVGTSLRTEVTRLNAQREMAGAEVFANWGRHASAGTGIDEVHISWAGSNASSSPTYYNHVSRLDYYGQNLDASAPVLGTKLRGHACARVADVAVFYGGLSSSGTVAYRLVLNSDGAAVVAAANISTKRRYSAGAGII